MCLNTIYCRSDICCLLSNGLKAVIVVNTLMATVQAMFREGIECVKCVSSGMKSSNPILLNSIFFTSAIHFTLGIVIP